jgi:endonuclease I
MAMRFRLFLAAALAGLVLFENEARGQYAPPATYYNAAMGTGETLKTQLRTIVSSMTGVNYGDARYSAPYTDADPNANGNILLIYNRASVSSTWDSGGTWNREHIWPVSRLGVSDPGNSTTNLSSDLFNLRPANPGINSSRGNKPFGLDSTTGIYGHQGSYFYPGDADAGDVARAQFYMATRYSQLTLTDGSPSGTQMGDLSSLLNYHYRDVPDEFEKRRNHAIYGLAGENSPASNNPYRQSNRNPYVDHPEFVWSVFANQENDSRLAIEGAVVDANGGSSKLINLGRAIVGAPQPTSTGVVVNKSGLDGTYFEISTDGRAASSKAGRYNAFAMGTAGSSSIDVGLNVDATSVGLYLGTVTIDNLDVTTQGGAGRGANDADDVISLEYQVLEHATPSFSEAGQATAFAYDFGVVPAGSTPTLSFDLFNLPASSGYAAGLDLDSILGVGDIGRFSTDLQVFGGLETLAAGGSRTFTASIDTSSPGAFTASYQLRFSDENLPGAADLGVLTLTLSGVVGVPEPASIGLILIGLFGIRATAAPRRPTKRASQDPAFP